MLFIEQSSRMDGRVELSRDEMTQLAKAWLVFIDQTVTLSWQVGPHHPWYDPHLYAHAGFERLHLSYNTGEAVS
jgi:hypothetical protein